MEGIKRGELHTFYGSGPYRPPGYMFPMVSQMLMRGHRVMFPTLEMSCIKTASKSMWLPDVTPWQDQKRARVKTVEFAHRYGVSRTRKYLGGMV